MKFKLTIAALALAILLSLVVAGATGRPNTHPQTGSAAPVAAQPEPTTNTEAVPQPATRPAPAHDRADPAGGTVTIGPLLLLAILIRRAARRR